MWNRVERACGGNRRLEILVGDMSLREASHDRAVVVVDSKLISTARSHTYEIETALHAAFGRTMKVDFSAATEAQAPVVAAEAKALPNMNEHPLVRQAVAQCAAGPGGASGGMRGRRGVRRGRGEGKAPAPTLRA
jgi:hypothetical protein